MSRTESRTYFSRDLARCQLILSYHVQKYHGSFLVRIRNITVETVRTPQQMESANMKSAASGDFTPMT
eukprot:767157-Hanusia_phi.AAC.9